MSDFSLRHALVPVGSVTLHVVECGQGPSVLLLHGFPELWYAWHRLLPALARAGFRAVAPDLRGYGSSGTTGVRRSPSCSPRATRSWCRIS